MAVYRMIQTEFWLDNDVLEMTPLAIKQLHSRLKEWPPEVVLHALQLAYEQGKTTLRYVNGILRNWRSGGCTTLAEVETMQRLWRSKQNTS